MRIMLLGADGNAGMNYCKCIKMEWPDAYIVGTGFNAYHLEAAYQMKLIDDYVTVNSEWSGNEKIAGVADLAIGKDIDFIHAQPEQEVRWLAENDTGILQGYRDTNILDITEDKFVTAIHLGEVCHNYVDAVLIPALFDECADLGGGKVWIRAKKGAGSKWALPVSTLVQAVHWVGYLTAEKGASPSDFIIQPYLPGKEYAAQIVVGKFPIAYQLRERVEHHFAKQMVSGQSSTPSVAKIVGDDDNPMHLVARKAMRTMKFKPGIYGIDMRIGADGLPHVTEINYGRYFTTIDFYASAGVNFPALEIKDLMGENVSLVSRGIDSDLYWIRGLDREPMLIREEDIYW